MLNSEKCTFFRITKKIGKAKMLFKKVYSDPLNSVLPIIIGASKPKTEPGRTGLRPNFASSTPY
jgi:hypothetical protein